MLVGFLPCDKLADMYSAICLCTFHRTAIQVSKHDSNVAIAKQVKITTNDPSQDKFILIKYL